MASDKPFKIGDFVTLKKDTGNMPECDDDTVARGLCHYPMGQITNILENGSLAIRVTYNGTARTYWYQPEEVTHFLFEVYVIPKLWGSPWNTYQDYFFIGRVIGHDVHEEITVENIYTGKTYEYSEDDIDESYPYFRMIKDPAAYFERMQRKNQHYKSLPTLKSMELASTQGTLQHLPINPNTKGKIMSYLSGYNVGTGKEKDHLKLLQEFLTREWYENVGVGANTRYEKPLPVRINFNNALNNGPLPHGPTEENFMGGKRSAPKQRKQKAIATRRRKRSSK